MALPQLRVTDLASAIQQSEFVPETQPNGNEVFCTYKPYVGDYLVGREQDSMLDEEVMLVVDTLAVGWILWHNSKCHEEFVPFITQLPRAPAIPEDIADACAEDGDNWNEARGVMFVTEDGLNVVWKAATLGIRKAIDPIIIAITTRANSVEDKDYLYPKVRLGVAEPYKSKKGGMIYNPLLEIISWHDVDGNAQVPAAAIDAPAEEAAPVKRKRRTAA